MSSESIISITKSIIAKEYEEASEKMNTLELTEEERDTIYSSVPCKSLLYLNSINKKFDIEKIKKAWPVEGFAEGIIDKETFMEVVTEDMLVIYSLRGESIRCNGKLSIDDLKKIIPNFTDRREREFKFSNNKKKVAKNLYTEEEIIEALIYNNPDFMAMGKDDIEELISGYTVTKDKLDLYLSLNKSIGTIINIEPLAKYVSQNELAEEELVGFILKAPSYLSQNVEFPEEYRNKETLDLLVGKQGMNPAYFASTREFISDDHWKRYANRKVKTLDDIRKVKFDNKRNAKVTNIPDNAITSKLLVNAYNNEFYDSVRRYRDYDFLGKTLLAHKFIATVPEELYDDYLVGKTREIIEETLGIDMQGRDYKSIQKINAYKLSAIANHDTLLSDKYDDYKRAIDDHEGLISIGTLASWVFSGYENYKQVGLEYKILVGKDKYKALEEFDSEELKGDIPWSSERYYYPELYKVMQEELKGEKTIVFENPSELLNKKIEEEEK
ncbi:MAG: hypothetical protein N4A47_03730 [Clostridia bacterium]|jgi:hypothetical protein|nr:hypothetical protein [Clostridia bacterium]